MGRRSWKLHPPDQLRTRIMRSNKSRGNTTTELRLMKLMRMFGIHGWRRGILLPGHPDFAFRDLRVVVFVDGCFWHGCTCKKTPKLNRDFWEGKFEANRLRDRQTT